MGSAVFFCLLCNRLSENQKSGDKRQKTELVSARGVITANLHTGLLFLLLLCPARLDIDFYPKVAAAGITTPKNETVSNEKLTRMDKRIIYKLEPCSPLLSLPVVTGDHGSCPSCFLKMSSRGSGVFPFPDQFSQTKNPIFKAATGEFLFEVCSSQ